MDTPAAARLHEELAEERRELVRDAVLTVVTLAGLVTGLVAPWIGLEAWRPWAFVVAYLAAGIPASRTAFASLREGDLDIDLLMVLAALAAAAVGEARDGAILLFLFQLAGTLEGYAMGTTKRAVAGLMSLRPDVARRVRGDRDEMVPVAEIAVGDDVRVLAGERIPVDATVVDGRSSVDASTLTGESVPVDVERGSTVFAGTVNGHGTLLVRVRTAAEASTLARMVDLVTEARAARAPSQRISDWFGQRYTGAVLVGAALALLAFGTFGPSWSDAFYKAATLLVVASPCAVVISVPAAVLSALAASARRGVLFKGGGALETFGAVDTFVFDKTGTLTEGKMQLADTRVLGDLAADEVRRIAGALEQHSEHPLARAIVDAARAEHGTLAEPSDVVARPGRGVEGTAYGRRWWIGNRRLATDHGVEPERAAREALESLEREGATAVWMGEGSRLVAAFGMVDGVRSEASDAVRTLRSKGVQRFVMLTGDAEPVARAVGDAIGLAADDVHAGLLPEDKVDHVGRLSREGHVVAYVGDGVNDAAALATANVGVAMGVAGSDVAIETADVALLSNDLRRLASALTLARRARRIVRQNLTFALGVMAVMVVWTLAFDLPLPLGVLGHEGGTLLVVANGLRTLFMRDV